MTKQNAQSYFTELVNQLIHIFRCLFSDEFRAEIKLVTSVEHIFYNVDITAMCVSMTDEQC